MGDINQLGWVGKHRDLISGPVIEIGSRHYTAQSSIDYRGLCAGLEYVGVDMSEGDNVDMVLDFTSDFGVIEQKLGAGRVRTVICCSVLEHVDNVFKMAQNVSRMMATGGVLFISVPFTWRFHGYPSDYWRFTPRGIKYLFPDFSFDEKYSTISSNVTGDVQPLSDDPNPFIVKECSGLAAGEYGFLERFRIFNIFRSGKSLLRKYHYVLLPSNINMVGVKK